jgi:hypothetical protein
MKLQHFFTQRTAKSPLKSRFVLTDGDETILETGSGVQVLRELKRRALAIPEQMKGPQCWSTQWTCEWEAA